MEPNKILIVDDHKVYRKSLKMLINRSYPFCEISEVENGLEFLELIKTEDFQIVLMDIKMPKMNGLKATNIAIKKYPKLKILGLSMFGTKEDIKTMRESGSLGFVRKGGKSQEIITAIDTILHGKEYFIN